MADATPEGARARNEADREAMIQRALVRITSLGMSDRDIERAAEIPAGFIAKARAGKNRGERAWDAGGSWEKLAGWLATKGPPLGAVGCNPTSSASVLEVVASALRSDVATGSLEDDIQSAKTAADFTKAAKRIALEVVQGRLDKIAGNIAINALREARASRKVEREETAREAVRVLEILTPVEVELLRAHRAMLAGPPLKPGEAAPPPAAKGEAA